ncbi:hypothetical protein Tco_0879925 [Tanacetum coccineum]
MQVVVSLAHHLTADVIRDGGASGGGDNRKKRQESQQRNRGRDQPDKRLRVARNYSVTAQKSKKRATMLGTVPTRLKIMVGNLLVLNVEAGTISKESEVGPLIDLEPEKLNEIYSVEQAKVHRSEAKEILIGRNLTLVDNSLNVDITLIELKSFNIVEEVLKEENLEANKLDNANQNLKVCRMELDIWRDELDLEG